MKLHQFPDNNEIAYKISLGAVTDITAPNTRWETVTRRQVREMFVRFIQASPELWPHAREEQIDQFNIERRKLNRPAVKAEILRELEIAHA
jgi:hypothetical protein